jgi:hypothetical protein
MYCNKLNTAEQSELNKAHFHNHGLFMKVKISISQDSGFEEEVLNLS